MNIAANSYLFLISFLTNLKNFLKSLTMIDVIFFFAVLLLMILLVTLYYFIKSNEDYYDVTDKSNNESNSSETLLENKEDLSASGFTEENAVININELDNSYLFNSISEDEEGELLDLETISKKLENKETTPIDLTMFEEEQERDAIISYDELIRKSSSPTVTYKKETMLDDLSVKEVDIESLSNSLVHKEAASEALSYSEEEEFLDSLKKLQQQLN